MAHFKGWSTSLTIQYGKKNGRDYLDVDVIPVGVRIATYLAGGKIGYLYGEKMGGCP
jgi:hypothetical protein